MKRKRKHYTDDILAYKRKLARNQFRYTIGNRKIGRDTLIFNMGPATDCPSRALGLCQLPDPNQCYALTAEVFYPKSLPFRRAQARYWKRNGPERIARDIRAALAKHKKIEYIRVNECGDFYAKECVEKICKIAAWVPDTVFYMYTARRDLMTKHLLAVKPRNLIINGSGFMADNAFIYEGKGCKYKCPGACAGCMLCKTAKRRSICVKHH
ncbi:MAG: hypothetical protein EOM59_10740 [Clostridia bacterium]|nr:hypothetical protein [Clostridia bacterium]